MKRANFSLVILLFSLLIGLLPACVAPVRNELFPDADSQGSSSDKEEVSLRPPDIEGIETLASEPRDTLVIEYGQEPEQPQEAAVENEIIAGMAADDAPDLMQEFEEALAKFDEGRYDEACSFFDLLGETLPEEDSLRYEALFMVAECSFIRNQLGLAGSRLDALYRDPAVPDGVLEKVMLRLGQSYCLNGETAKAEDIFNRFTVVFPESVYMPLATCDSVD